MVARREQHYWNLGSLKNTKPVCSESPGLNLPSAVVHCCSQDFPKTWSTLSPWRTTRTPLLMMVAWGGAMGHRVTNQTHSAASTSHSLDTEPLPSCSAAVSGCWPRLSWNFLCSPAWSQAHSSPPGSTSQELGLQLCLTTASLDLECYSKAWMWKAWWPAYGTTESGTFRSWDLVGRC